MYLNYAEHKAGVYVIDIETEEDEEFHPDIIWCMCWENVLTGETGDCVGHDEIHAFFENTKRALYIGHNGLKFDFPVISRVVGVRLSISQLIDTLVLSTLYSPNIQGGHSLEAWGERLNEPKGDFNDWSAFSMEMLVYCRQDVSITAKLFRRLVRTMDRIGFTERSIAIQHRWMVILDRQRRNGFRFDYGRGIGLFNQLRARESEIENEVHKVFPPHRVLVRDGAAITKDGRRTAILAKDLQRFEVELSPDGARYQAYESVPFNLGSPKQRVDKLTGLGWVPEEFTPAGGAKPFDKGDLSPSLTRFLDESPVPEVLLIAKWMSINGRGNMVKTWLDNWNEETGCIHGKLFVADTLRLRHQAPNTANIPAVRVDKKSGLPILGEPGYFTYEARDLWRAREGRILVGTDAAGLELRMLAHYLNRPKFTDTVINGDPHQFNADTVGIPRPLAKTLLYAIQYGAQAKKVASIIKSTVSEGALVREQFLERLGLKEVMEDAQREQAAGRIELVDGSFVVCPSPHSALNYRLQGGGARVMAQASIFLESSIKRDGCDCLKVGDIHDEWQYDVDPKDADHHRKISVQAIRDAGEELGFNLPLDGTSKKGMTWAETH